MALACALAALLVAPAAGSDAGSDPGSDAGSGFIYSEPEETAADTRADAPGSGSRAERVRLASLEHAARRYAEAARAYEALHEEFSDTALLLAAARSRQAAGHNAHAAMYLSQLVASGQLTAADTQVAYGELQAAQRAVTPVTVRVHLPAELATASPRLTAHYVSRYPSEQRPPLGFSLPPGSVPVRVVILQLDPGPWRLQIDDPALAAVDVLVDVLRQPGAVVELDLRRHDAPGLPRTQRHRLAAALGGIGGAVAGVGVGLTVRGELGQVQPALARPLAACPDRLVCREDLAAAMTGRSVGAGLLGAGAGTMLGGLTALVRDDRQRRGLWIFELALGAAGAIGGGFAVALAARGFDRENVAGDRPWGDPEYTDTIRRRGNRHTIAAAGLGLGSGLAFGAATGLIYTRAYHRRHPEAIDRRVRPGLGLGAGLGLTLSGRF